MTIRLKSKSTCSAFCSEMPSSTFAFFHHDKTFIFFRYLILIIPLNRRDVRKTIVWNIGLNVRTIDIFVAHSRDLEPSIRKLIYSRLALEGNGEMDYLTGKLRCTLLRNGLNDRLDSILFLRQLVFINVDIYQRPFSPPLLC